MDNSKIFSRIFDFCLEKIHEELKKPTFRIENDIGHSVLRLKYIKYIFTFERLIHQNSSMQLEIVSTIIKRYILNKEEFITQDNEPFRVILEGFKKTIAAKILDKEKEATLLKLFLDLFKAPEFYQVEFMPCVAVILENLLAFNYLKENFETSADLNVYFHYNLLILTAINKGTIPWNHSFIC